MHTGYKCHTSIRFAHAARGRDGPAAPAAMAPAAASASSMLLGTAAAIVLSALIGTSAVAWPCTCANESLCRPLQTAPPEKEVWAFAIGPADPTDPLGRSAGFFDYNWSVASPQPVCSCH